MTHFKYTFIFPEVKYPFKTNKILYKMLCKTHWYDAKLHFVGFPQGETAYTIGSRFSFFYLSMECPHKPWKPNIYRFIINVNDV